VCCHDASCPAQRNILLLLLLVQLQCYVTNCCQVSCKGRQQLVLAAAAAACPTAAAAAVLPLLIA
jgi:hypothetical protein